MKNTFKRITQVSLIIIFAISLYSCSNDDDTAPEKKIRLKSYDGKNLSYNTDGYLSNFDNNVFVYNLENKLVREGSITITYDTKGRVKKYGRVTYTYDINDRVKKTILTYEDGHLDSFYTYNNKGLVIERFTESYNNRGSVSYREKYKYTYDKIGNLIQREKVDHIQTSKVLAFQVYTYDDKKNPLRLVLKHSGQDTILGLSTRLVEYFPGSIALDTDRGYNYISPNNVLTYHYSNSDNNNLMVTVQNDYEYDEKGYPINVQGKKKRSWKEEGVDKSREYSYDHPYTYEDSPW